MNIDELTDYAQQHCEDVITKEEVREAVATVIEDNGMAPTINYSQWVALQVLNELK